MEFFEGEEVEGVGFGAANERKAEISSRIESLKALGYTAPLSKRPPRVSRPALQGERTVVLAPGILKLRSISGWATRITVLIRRSIRLRTVLVTMLAWQRMPQAG